MRNLCSIITLLVLMVLICSPADAQEVVDPFPDAASSYLMQVDGKIVWAHSPDKRLPMASITKMMTVMLAFRHIRLDEFVTVSKDASSMEKGWPSLGLEEGEKVYAGFLIAASLVQSANDACHALADHVAGDEKRFVKMMNQEAKRLGMADTHFANACGHDNPKHYSTTSDLVILAEALMNVLKEKNLSDLVAVSTLDVYTNERKKSFQLINKNPLIGRYPGAVGVKSGTTPAAGKCLIALAERDGVKAMLVLLNAPNRRWDAEKMFDAVFANTKQQLTKTKR